jgi:riboflavin kinase/FMN adenylyltransferase
MDLVAGVDGLEPANGPIFAVVGVFDGLHRGHAYLLEHLVGEAHARSARSCVITFDAHPDAVLTGSAPPLLLHPDERLQRLAAAGVEVTVVQHFDEALRHTPYDAFVGTIQTGTVLAGLLMTPDAAFGFERRGTPDTLAALGREHAFDVVVVPPFELDGRPVHSAQIRAAIAAGELDTAARLLGRPVSLRGEIRDGSLSFDWPLALPPEGDYACTVHGSPARLSVRAGLVRLDRFAGPNGPVEVTLAA